mmetsp:Transcript_23005/g.54321  ORF Transcript_23005/g.54321 Transcript_23005/m.54321 type:complete len:81 (-) Transcript_23005:180-422(-)
MPELWATNQTNKQTKQTGRKEGNNPRPVEEDIYYIIYIYILLMYNTNRDDLPSIHMKRCNVVHVPGEMNGMEWNAKRQSP